MTAAELRNRILRRIGVAGIGRAASPEDAEFTDTVITEAHAELDQLEVTNWTTSDIPNYAVDGLQNFILAELAPAFGYPLDPNLKELGLRQLRKVTQDRRHSTGTSEFF